LLPVLPGAFFSGHIAAGDNLWNDWKTVFFMADNWSMSYPAANNTVMPRPFDKKSGQYFI